MTRLATPRGARRKYAADLATVSNVVGTALGLKRRQERRVSGSALIIYVRQKLPLDALAPDDRLPTEVLFSEQSVPTDVVEIAGMRREFGSAPFYISDGVKKGTISAFAADGSHLYAVSCAHCMRGRDGNPHTSDPIDFWEPALGRYVPGGENGFAVDAPGLGLPGNFGFSDAGLILLEHRELLRRARAASVLPIIGRLSRGMPVASQGPRGAILGTVEAVEAVIDRVRIDIVIKMPNGGSVPGNSGMLWRSRDGSAVGMHAIGAYTDNSGESRYSLCMSAGRLASTLQVRLLDPHQS